MNDIGSILFLGAGKMAGALAGGLVRGGYDAARIAAYDVSAPAARTFSSATGVVAHTERLSELVDAADIVVLAVKPQYLSEALQPLEGGSIKKKLIISIVAGAALKTLAEITEAERIIRVMPNTPALVGQGAAAYAVAANVTARDIAAVETILGAVGYFCRVQEKMMDAVTGLSGSGPAYVFDFIQALSDGGVRLGLPRAEATKLAAMTVMGAAKMVLESNEHPAVLRDQVTSPGGTTIAGLAVLERMAFRSATADAVAAAAARSSELGKK